MWAFKDHGKTHEAVLGAASLRLSLAARTFRLQFPSNGSKAQSAASSFSACRSGCRFARAMLSCSPKRYDLHAVRVPLPPEHLTHAWYKFMPSCSLRRWLMAGAVTILAGNCCTRLSRPPAAAVKFIWRSAFRMLAVACCAPACGLSRRQLDVPGSSDHYP